MKEATQESEANWAKTEGELLSKPGTIVLKPSEETNAVYQDEIWRMISLTGDQFAKACTEGRHQPRDQGENMR